MRPDQSSTQRVGQVSLRRYAAGQPLMMFGEWDGAAFEPHTVQRSRDLFMVARLGDLAVLSKVA